MSRHLVQRNGAFLALQGVLLSSGGLKLSAVLLNEYVVILHVKVCATVKVLGKAAMLSFFFLFSFLSSFDSAGFEY